MQSTHVQCDKRQPGGTSWANKQAAGLATRTVWRYNGLCKGRAVHQRAILHKCQHDARQVIETGPSSSAQWERQRQQDLETVWFIGRIHPDAWHMLHGQAVQLTNRVETWL